MFNPQQDVNVDQPQQVEEQQPINTDVDSFRAPLPPAVASARAGDAHFGLGTTLGRTHDEILTDITGGREDELRTEASRKVDAERSKLRADAITSQVYSLQPGAQLKPEDLTAVDAHLAATKGSWPSLDPTSIIEAGYANRWTQHLSTPAPDNPGSYSWVDTVLLRSQQASPQDTMVAQTKSEDAITLFKFIETKLHDTQAALKAQNIFSEALDIGKTFLPGYTSYTFGSFLPGTALEKQRLAILSLPTKDAIAKINADVNSMTPIMAMQYLQGLQGGQDEFLNNLFGILDASTFIGVGGRLLAGALKRGTDQVIINSAYKSAVKAAPTDAPATVAAPAAAGDLGESAVKQVTINVTSDLMGMPEPERRLIDAIPSLYKGWFDQIKANPGRMGQAIVDKLEPYYSNLSTNFTQMITNIAKVNQIPVIQATEKAIKIVQENVRRDFMGIDSAVRDVGVPVWGPLTNRYYTPVHVTNFDGTLFSSPETAQNFMKLHGELAGADIVVAPQGGGWELKVWKPLDETQPALRQLLMEFAGNKSPVRTGFAEHVNAVMGYLRTPEETLALQQRINRKIATYAPNAIYQVLKEDLEDVRKLRAWAPPFSPRRQKWNEWNQMVKATKKMQDAQGKPGRDFFSPQEVEEYYWNAYNRAPDQQEIAAYFALSRTRQTDYIFRNLKKVKDLMRVGAEQHRFMVGGDFSPLESAGKTTKSNWFNGVDITKNGKLPGGNYPVLFLGENAGEEKVFSSNKAVIKNSKYSKLVNDALKNGARMFEVAEPYLRPFEGFGKEVGDIPIRYVVAPRSETKPLDFIQIPYRGGGHFDYDYSHYIKQAIVKFDKATKVHTYEGDQTFMPISLPSMGKDVVRRLELVREATLAGSTARDYANAKSVLANSGLPIEWKDWINYVTPTKDATGRLIPARFNLKEPFRLVESGKSTLDLDKTIRERYLRMGKGGKVAEDFRDATREGRLVGNVPYTQERDSYDLFTPKDEGTIHNPVYKFEPAKFLDPIPSMNRAMQKVVNSTFLDDYKNYSIEHWIREYKDILDASSAELLSQPAWIFHQPKFLESKENATRIRQAKVQNFQIQQLLGQHSETDTVLQSAAQRLSDYMYTKLGPKGIPLSPAWSLPYLRDPFGFMRAVTFHAKLGMFAVPQLWVQMQTFANIWALGGKHAVPGTAGAYLNVLASINSHPAILRHLDGIASKLGFRPGEFTEVRELLQRTGFGIVGPEYALVDAHMMPSLVRSGGRQFLDAGTWFFRNGERMNRWGAFMTSYKEFRAAKPHGKITNSELGEILNRADDMSVNMSRASSSMMHQGILSLPTQFLSYQLRQAELFWGKRMTWQEKARMIGWNAALYGAPVSLGVTGYPFQEHIKQKAQEYGYNVGNSYAADLAMNGLPATLLSLINGTHYNYGDRFGNQGFSSIADFLRGDKGFLDMLGGASFSTFANTLGAANPFYQVLVSGITGTGDFKLSSDDIAQMFREISSFNYAYRGWMAVDTGKWMSKKGTVLYPGGDFDKRMSLGDIIAMTATGTQPQEVSDLMRLTHSLEDRKATQKYYEDKFVQEWQRGMWAFRDNDPETGHKHWKNAFGWLQIGDFPNERIIEALRRASSGNEALLDKLNLSFYTRNVPESWKEMYMKAYGTYLRNRQ